MVQLLTSLVGLVFVLIHGSRGQFDPDWCPEGQTPPPPDSKWRPIPSRFEIITELVDASGVMEITQAFSTNRDTIYKNSANNPALFYWDFQTNEHLKVPTTALLQQKKPDCIRQILTPVSLTSIVEENTIYLKPSIILGFDPRNQVNPLWGIRYDTNGSLRDIPTNIFKSCFFVSDINATVKVTYHVADTSTFQTYLSNNESLILQFDVNMTASPGRQQTYTYNVFGYIPNPSRGGERQALETPSGVYCVNRTSDIAVPSNIPDRVSTNAEIFQPTFNNSIFSAHNLYDSEFQFSRFEVWLPNPSGRSDWLHYTQMHDFAVGLSYQYNHGNRQCSVTDINLDSGDVTTVDGNPSLLQMGDPQHLFLMDDITYQYTGEKQCRDRVWCNVWIGENHFPNNTVEHREWYWAVRVNNEPLTQWIPMKLILKTYISGNLNSSVEMTLFNYRTNPMTIFEIDYTLADCYRALGPTENFNLGVLSFRIANDKQYPVFQNLNYLRLHIWETLIFTLFIRPIRISNIIVDKDDNDILVTFTLLDAAPRTGPVEVPILESSLDSLIERLTKIIDSNGLAFRARYGTKQVVLRACTNSLNIAHLSTQQKSVDSGPLITGLWIGCGIVGLLIGGIGGFFLFQRLAKN